MYEDYLYARISEDDTDLEKGVARQLRNLRILSAADGARIAGEYSDNDISATNGDHRPDYQRMIAAITSPNPTGVQRRIVCVHTSRVWRNRTERAIGIDTLGKKHKIIIRPMHGPMMDLRTAAGRMLAGIMGETDTGESETKAERINDAVLERAEEGRANGRVLYGWQRVYEYDSRGKVVGFHDDECLAEAEIVREIVRRLLVGDTIKGITADLNRRGVQPPRRTDRRKKPARSQADSGAQWGHTSVQKIALRPANIGLRMFHRGRPDERMLPAAWPMLVEPDDHDRVVALLSNPSRRTSRDASRQHLLTYGIGECGLCGGDLRVAMMGSRPHGNLRRTYVCDPKGCVGRNEAAVDRRVDAVMVALLSRPDVLDLLSGSQSRQAELLGKASAIRARMQSVAVQFAEDRITADQLATITARLKPEAEAAEAAARAEQPTPYLALVVDTVGQQAKRRWETLSVVQKRAVMGAFGVRVAIDPTRRGPGFDPTSVRVVPRAR